MNTGRVAAVGWGRSWDSLQLRLATARVFDGRRVELAPAGGNPMRGGLPPNHLDRLDELD